MGGQCGRVGGRRELADPAELRAGADAAGGRRRAGRGAEQASRVMREGSS